jgi:hypothetical protein
MKGIDNTTVTYFREFPDNPKTRFVDKLKHGGPRVYGCGLRFQAGDQGSLSGVGKHGLNSSTHNSETFKVLIFL